MTMTALACGQTLPAQDDAGDGGSSNDGAPVEAGAGPVTLATGQANPGLLAVGGGNVYWLNAGDGPPSPPNTSLMKCASAGCGGAPTLLVDNTGLGQPLISAPMVSTSGIAADALNVYVSATPAPTVSWNLMSCPATGCKDMPPILVSDKGPFAFAVDATSFYWGTNSAVQKCPLAGCNGAPTTLVTNGASNGPLVVSATGVYWIGNETITNGYFGDVLMCSIGGCAAPTVIASAQPSPTALAIDGSYVYWTVGEETDAGTAIPAPQSILRCTLGGCNGKPTALVTNASAIRGLVSDGANLYWTNAPGDILRCPVAGCANAPTTIVPAQSGPRSFAVDDTSLYWANGDGTIMKLTPK
ncbi:MAG TPA: hypothetical protein VLM85_05730 [Polyangiaceae bacterium]|nr:hypothetical protein [Polyangiaceae bacterium]